MQCTVTSIQSLAAGFFHLSLTPEKPLGPITPGQFVMIRCGESTDPLLRRPMSVADFEADGSRLGLLVQIAGRGTGTISRLDKGDQLDLIGPFGQGYSVPPEARTIVIVAGGTGVAPFMTLTPTLVSQGKDVHVLLGARTKELLLMEEWFLHAGASLHVATDDGSKGFDGLVTALMMERLDHMEEPPDMALACGPAGMMRAVAALAEHNNIPCQVSLENSMACGFGACLGCVAHVRGEKRYVTVCRKGPVFDSREVLI
ncbi:MAG: dihydroorotate dehydrogenase electron transfer subunit [Nitrospinota bacterium]|nr:dihydroorotate dehydrogenase electron transfer subunit [Nitrospinota bacterium]